VGWEKVACWSTKATISLKHVKIEEKLLWRAYRNLPTLIRTVPSPTPFALLFPKIGDSKYVVIFDPRNMGLVTEGMRNVLYGRLHRSNADLA